MSKHRLILDDQYEFLAFGLSCHLKDYRVAWMINQAFKMNLKRFDISLEVKKNEPEVFSVYRFKDQANHLNYHLLSNQNESSYLLPSLKQYDYFILIEGYIDIFDANMFEQQLQHIDSFQFISELDIDPFQKMQYTLFED
ncbi:MAG: IPExxxVDY family protein [Salibacteraceae bacterium]